MGLFGFDYDKKLSPEERYGKYMMMLVRGGISRDKGYNKFSSLYEDGFAEAGIVLGQYYMNKLPRVMTRRYFETAASAGIAEGHWGAYGCINPNESHSMCIDGCLFDETQLLSLEDCQATVDRKERMAHLVAAAHGGCADACNEMGNHCNRESRLVEGMYWYGLANYLGHQHGAISMKKIAKKWEQNGSSTEYLPGPNEFTKRQHSTAVTLLEIFSGECTTKHLDCLMRLTLEGDVLAGLALGSTMKNSKHYDMAYTVYNALAFTEHPHALKCYADMLLKGVGTEQDVTSALQFYMKAAKKGNAPSMYVMGENERGAGNINMAAYWYGMALVRGFEPAGTALEKLIKAN